MFDFFFSMLLVLYAIISSLAAAEVISKEMEPVKLLIDEPTKFNVTGTSTYAQAINYGKTNPTRDGGSWSGW